MKISPINLHNIYINPAFCKNKTPAKSTVNNDDISNAQLNIPFDKSGFYTSGIKQKPKLDDNTFQIRMQGYMPRNEKGKETSALWGKNMVELTYKISDMISANKDFDEILRYVEDGIHEINGRDYGKRDLDSRYYPLMEDEGRGVEYWEKYCNFDEYEENVESYWKLAHNPKMKTLHRPKPNEEYKDANVCKILYRDWQKKIYYGRNKEKPYYNLELAKREYEKLKSIEKPQLKDINRSCATIQWLIAQESPYAHGNDSIANVLTKAIYHSYGIKTGQIKTGHSLDFEAFYRDLDDYIEVYPYMFEEKLV